MVFDAEYFCNSVMALADALTALFNLLEAGFKAGAEWLVFYAGARAFFTNESKHLQLLFKTKRELQQDCVERAVVRRLRPVWRHLLAIKRAGVRGHFANKL